MTYEERAKQLINQHEKSIRDAFLAAIDNVTDDATLKDLVAALEANDIQRASDLLRIAPGAFYPVQAAITAAFYDFGLLAGSAFPKVLNTPVGRAVFRFDMRNPRAENWLREESSGLIKDITDDMRATVRQELEAGISRGNNPRTTALDIIGRIDPATGSRVGGSIGLAPNQQVWVNNSREYLTTLDKRYFNMSLRDKRFDRTVAKAIADGKPLDKATIEKLVGRYKTAALRYRGESIGRTETLNSLNAAEYESIMQTVDMGAASKEDIKRFWDATGDNKTRWQHQQLDGQARALDDPFIAPDGTKMLYPGDRRYGAPAKQIVACRCRVRTEVDFIGAAIRKERVNGTR